MRTTTDPYGDALMHPMHGMLRELTGISGDLIRPRWQQEPPETPGIDTDWLAFGLQGVDMQPWGFETEGMMVQHESASFLLSFYGPGALSLAGQCRANSMLTLNEWLLDYGLQYGSSSQITPAPEVHNARWFNRYDLSIEYRRKIAFEYDINTIASANVYLYNDAGTPARKIEVSE